MGKKRFRIGSVAVLFAVVVLCVAIFGVLTVATAVADRRTAQQYGDHMAALYACENAGQQWLSQADAYLSGQGQLPPDTQEADGTLRTTITRENMSLEICLDVADGEYEIRTWSCRAAWEPEASWSLTGGNENGN